MKSPEFGTWYGLGFEGGFGCVNLVQKPRILQLLGLGFCKENRSRILEMTLGENYILGLIYCKGLKKICGVGLWKELRVCLE